MSLKLLLTVGGRELIQRKQVEPRRQGKQTLLGRPRERNGNGNDSSGGSLTDGVEQESSQKRTLRALRLKASPDWLKEEGKRENLGL